MATAGKSSLFKVSATAGGAGTYTTVAEGKQASMKFGKQALEFTYFGDNWREHIDGSVCSTRAKCVLNRNLPISKG